MKNIFVVGAGTMGLDIAQVFAAAGFSVTVRDITSDIIEKAQNRLTTTLNKRVERGKMTKEDMDAIVNSIRFTTELQEANDADLVVEAIIEKIEAKQSLFAELDGICKESAIFASNTSSISITAIAQSTKRADRFIGMHFFNPATVMKLVEVIRGIHTSDETFEAIFSLSEKIGKTPVKVEEAPGFVVNRLLIPMINEAVGLLTEGVASASDIDSAMKLGANHPMGPLELADLIGLDVCLAIMDTLYQETHDTKYRAHTLLRKMVRGGLLGRKTKKGFYEY
ncbi:MAG TPA: 3-hydroxybutyryl-CoA dehydrogenase [Clostridiales bacterium]|jgi:3-hydroxybutyryl-CoA dehydrogenase|nr:3-hydroxybutyryl-CoA dehydrogenase [Clostridiales bacterium]